MPWESAGGGGGVNLSAAGYLVLGGLKYSQNDDAREIFAIVEDVLFAQNADDFHILTSHIMDFVTDSELVESTEPIYKINKGRKKVQQGEVYLLSPYSSPVKRIYGGYLIIYGNFLIIQGVVSGLVEVHDDRI